MGPFPIESERLLLREFREEDGPAIHAYASDLDVTRFTAWGPNDADQSKAVLRGWLIDQETWPRDSIPLAIELKAEARLIGGSGFSKVDFENRWATFGYVLHPAYWGNGFATEASRALLEFGFRALSLHRIVASCDVRNAASYRVLEKLGMRREAHYRKDATKAGEWRDTYLYAILEEEWAS